MPKKKTVDLCLRELLFIGNTEMQYSDRVSAFLANFANPELLKAENHKFFMESVKFALAKIRSQGFNSYIIQITHRLLAGSFMCEHKLLRPKNRKQKTGPNQMDKVFSDKYCNGSNSHKTAGFFRCVFHGTEIEKLQNVLDPLFAEKNLVCIILKYCFESSDAKEVDPDGYFTKALFGLVK